MLKNFVDITTVSQPVTDANYTEEDAPVSVYYGVLVKNRYDDDRLDIINGRKIKHKVLTLNDAKEVTRYLYGVKIDNPLLALKIYKDFSPDMDKIEDSIYIDSYMHHLKTYKLTCDECYSSVCRGMLAIDGIYVNEISEDIPLNVFNVQHDDPQWYLRYASCHIYILHR